MNNENSRYFGKTANGLIAIKGGNQGGLVTLIKGGNYVGLVTLTKGGNQVTHVRVAKGGNLVGFASLIITHILINECMKLGGQQSIGKHVNGFSFSTGGKQNTGCHNHSK